MRGCGPSSRRSKSCAAGRSANGSCAGACGGAAPKSRRSSSSSDRARRARTHGRARRRRLRRSRWRRAARLEPRRRRNMLLRGDADGGIRELRHLRRRDARRRAAAARDGDGPGRAPGAMAAGDGGGGGGRPLAAWSCRRRRALGREAAPTAADCRSARGAPLPLRPCGSILPAPGARA